MDTPDHTERYLWNNDAAKEHLLRWWKSMMLSEAELKKEKIRPAPSGHKAQLKRCSSVDAAMLTEGFRNLWLSLPEEITTHARASDMECWATLAAALVHVKKVSGFNLATAAGKKNDSGKSVVSEMRFAQLRSANTADEFLQRLRRILKQVKETTQVIALGVDIEQWFREKYDPTPRKADKRISVRWAMEYYRAAAGK